MITFGLFPQSSQFTTFFMFFRFTLSGLLSGNAEEYMSDFRKAGGASKLEEEQIQAP